MLRSIKQLYGEKLAAADGDVGRVKDFYFDDARWAVRYVVVDTDHWLAGRLVLISPHAFGNFYQSGDRLLVELTRKQIENSPPVGSHKPISRQYEEEYYRYYGWPGYWNGLELWGGAGYPVVPPPPGPLPGGGDSGRSPNSDDSHLRSTKGVAGYHIQTGDGPIGHVIDFIIDDRNWAVRHLVIETGHWYSGREIVIEPADIQRISYDESTVFVKVTKAAIQESTRYQMPRAQYHDARDIAQSPA